MLSVFSRAALLASLAACAAAAFWFRGKQNRAQQSGERPPTAQAGGGLERAHQTGERPPTAQAGGGLERAHQSSGAAMGGKISNPKLLWLFFAIWFWLFECAVLAFEPALPSGYRIIFGVHALSMWLRGGVEMFMLYVTKNWRPPIGITHDVLCIVTVSALGTALPLPLDSAWSWFAPALVVMLVFSLVVEVLYAAMFFQAVEGKTTGDKGVWFASEDEARFARINKVTTALNVPQVAFQLVLLGVAFSR